MCSNIVRLFCWNVHRLQSGADVLKIVLAYCFSPHYKNCEQFSMWAIATGVERSVVTCLSVCYAHYRSPQKPLNRFRCRLAVSRFVWVKRAVHTSDEGQHWRHLANTLKWSVRCVLSLPLLYQLAISSSNCTYSLILMRATHAGAVLP